MAYLIKRKDTGRWYIRFRDNLKNEQWVSTKTKSKTEANEIFREFLIKGKARSTGNVMLSELKKEVFRYVKLNLPRSLDSYLQALNTFQNVIGDKPVKLITVSDIEYYKSVRIKINSMKRKGRTLSFHSVNREIRTIKSAFAKALEIELIQENRLRKAKQLKVSKNKFRKRFTFAEKIKIFDSIKNVALYRACTVARHTGMRLNEIICLQRKDIDLLSSVIRIQNDNGFEAKTESSQRNLSINETLKTELKNWLGIDDSNIHNLFNPDDYVLNYDGHKYSKGYISRQFSRLMKKLGIDGNFHCLRHTFASELIESGVDIETLRNILGHTKITTTAIYLQSLDENKQNAMSKAL